MEKGPLLLLGRSVLSLRSVSQNLCIGLSKLLMQAMPHCVHLESGGNSTCLVGGCENLTREAI